MDIKKRVKYLIVVDITFGCKTSTLKDWIYLYKNTNNLSRNNRKPISNKIIKN